MHHKCTALVTHDVDYAIKLHKKRCVTGTACHYHGFRVVIYHDAKLQISDEFKLKSDILLSVRVVVEIGCINQIGLTLSALSINAPCTAQPWRSTRSLEQWTTYKRRWRRRVMYSGIFTERRARLYNLAAEPLRKPSTRQSTCRGFTLQRMNEWYGR